LAEDAQLEGRIHTRDEGLALIGRTVQADGASER
jgi:hypothetical protein